MGRFADKEYVNWVKCSQALVCVAEGLAPFCKDVIEKFHHTLKENLGEKTCTAGCSAKKIYRRNNGWSISCPSDICNKWLDDIAKEIGTLQCAWRNSDVSKWPIEYWQIGKVFMGHGQDSSNVDPHKTDAMGLLQLMINCKKFQSCLDTLKAKKVSLYALM